MSNLTTLQTNAVEFAVQDSIDEEVNKVRRGGQINIGPRITELGAVNTRYPVSNF